VSGWTTQRGTKIRGALDDLRANALLLDQLIGWLTGAEANLSAQTHEILPDNLPIIEQLLHDHQVVLPPEFFVSSCSCKCRSAVLGHFKGTVPISS
jgi:hypothetical protein